MTNVTGFIPEEDYKNILKLMPIPTVDVVVVWDGKFLLGKRVNKPDQGKWWIFGGRVFKGESLEDAMIRKAKEELGLDIDKSNLRFLVTGESMFDESELGGSTHTINAAYLVEFGDEPEIKFDESQISEVKWFSDVPDDLHPYMKFALKKAGFE